MGHARGETRRPQGAMLHRNPAGAPDEPAGQNQMTEHSPTDPGAAAEQLDAHVREIVRWHFSPETGSPFWLEWARQVGWNPAEEIQGYADLRRFPHFQDEWL